ncbi:hypothetical protein [Pararhodonellum marinum]|uniref:hypothetical protein n=1 Tax=Pararhodonellum marinum TaxID=2755358 RepID=UPI001E559A16|nr:hypothetical protein [Pararhodonellum marinum]
MKKIFAFLFVMVLSIQLSLSQDRKYLVFEFMRVDIDQMFDYIEYKEFMEKVYSEAVNSGDITGWDFWSMKSGGSDQQFQYVTITYFNDPVKMMNGLSESRLIALANKVYPDMSINQLTNTIKNASKYRDLALRSYMVEIDHSKDNFKMKPGTLASFDLMKAHEGRFDEYEDVEMRLYKPWHEKKINNDLMASWSLLRNAVPTGSEASYTHMTLNVYSDYMQFFNSMEYEDLDISEERQMEMEKGLSSRDQKWVYLATLETTVR